MVMEYMWGWFEAETREKETDSTNYIKVGDLVRTAFREGHLSEESTCKTAITIPKVTATSGR